MELMEHGGLLIIYAKKFINNKEIQSNGSDGTLLGAGSGAGSINIFYQEKENIGNIECKGGNGGNDGNQESEYRGGNGGDGSVTYGKISSGTFTIFEKGDGTERSPYLIEDETMLRRFANSVVEDNTYEGKNIKLINNIELDKNKEWTPIGNNITQFKGTFDGNKRTIKGLNINNTLTNQGLFSTINEVGTVKNIVVEGNIQSGCSSGGICAVNYGTIKRCKNKIVVAVSGGYGAGGICATNYGTIDECCNLANISIPTSYDSVGGITGNNEGVIKKCYNTGTISCSTYVAGGIAGHHAREGKNGYIYNCYNNANIENGIGNYSGGIAGGYGYQGGAAYIYNSYTIKNTKVHSTNGDYRDSAYTGTIDIKNCYAEDANAKIKELNDGIDAANGEDTEQPWITDTAGINEGYPILYWQLEF